MNPWDILGWLLVIIIGLIVVVTFSLSILLIVAGVLKTIEDRRKKKTKFEKNYEIFKSKKEDALDGF